MFMEENELDAMAKLSDNYSIEHLLPNLEPFFDFGLSGRPFVRATAKISYGTLWKPKPNFEEWIFACSKNDFHIRLALKNTNMKAFLLVPQTESICRLTFLHGKYVVITLCSLEQINHVHSIVIDMELEFCRFSPSALAFFWGRIVVEGQKEKIMSMEWQEQNGEDLEP